MTAQELSETVDTAAFKEAQRGGWDALAAGWRKWSHVTEADQAVRLERTDPFADGLHAALGGNSKAGAATARRSASAPLASEPRMGSPSSSRMKGGDRWTAHAAQSTSRP